MNENELVSVAMQIILHAGDARVEINKALKAAKKFDFNTAKSCMTGAEQCVLKAHKAQTEIIQNEASGKVYPYSLLFAHAQDTLMTINSEYRMASEMIDILHLIKNS